MYSTEIDGEVVQFGTSGFLYRSNKLMYDRNTNTLWHQFLGEPVLGELAHSGMTLELLPVVLTTWAEWLAAHPETSVLDAETGVYPAERYLPESDRQSTYYAYRFQADTMFPVPGRNQALPVKSQVLGITFNGQPRAYPQSILQQAPLINDSLGGGELVVVTPGDGGGSRAYQRSGVSFVEIQQGQGEDGSIVLIDNEGQGWNLEEDALARVDDPSTRLLRLPSRTAYWFGWYSFYPGTEVFTGAE